MKEMDDRRRFIALRAKGVSYRKIEAEIGVSRKTLANWGEVHQEEIMNLRAVEMEALREEFRMTKPARVEDLGEVLTRMREELVRRDFSRIPTAKLIELMFKYSAQLSKEIGEPRVYSESELETLYGMRMALKWSLIGCAQPNDASSEDV